MLITPPSQSVKASTCALLLKQTFDIDGYLSVGVSHLVCVEYVYFKLFNTHTSTVLVTTVVY